MSEASNDKNFIKTQIFRCDNLRETIANYRKEAHPFSRAQYKASARRKLETLRKTLPDAKSRYRKLENREIDVYGLRKVLTERISEFKI